MARYPENFILQPQNLAQLIDFIRQASLLEVNTPKKPGNVGPEQDIKNVTIQDFNSAISAITEEIQTFFNEWIREFRTNFSRKKALNTPFSLGHFIYRLCSRMINAQTKGNVLLGHILLFSPLIFAAVEMINHYSEINHRTWIQYWKITGEILQETTVDDGVWLYRSIALVQPGGLKNPGGKQHNFEFDFTSPDVEQKIIQNKRTFYQLFNETGDFDTISKEILTNYEISRKFFIEELYPRLTTNSFTPQIIQNLFISLLAAYPDSHIYRKSDLDTALDIQKDAIKIKKLTQENFDLSTVAIEQINQKLIQKGLNPGTTADLTACIILLGLLFIPKSETEFH
jgi:triphosphoribosyl-dephospho-CoA synthase